MQTRLRPHPAMAAAICTRSEKRPTVWLGGKSRMRATKRREAGGRERTGERAAAASLLPYTSGLSSCMLGEVGHVA